MVTTYQEMITRKTRNNELNIFILWSRLEAHAFYVPRFIILASGNAKVLGFLRLLNFGLSRAYFIFIVLLLGDEANSSEQS